MIKSNLHIFKNFPVFLLGLIIGALLLLLLKDVIFIDREPQIVLNAVQLVTFGKKGTKPTKENLKNVVIECEVKEGKWKPTSDISFKTKNGRSFTFNLKQIVSICSNDGNFEIETENRWYKAVSFSPVRMRGQSENVMEHIFDLQKGKDFFIGFKREITGNTCLDNVMYVKSSYLENFQSATIGDAFDSYFLNPTWKGLQLKNGARTVSFKGERKFRRSKIYVTALFVIDVEKTVQVQKIAIIFTSSSFPKIDDDNMFLERFLGYPTSAVRSCSRYFAVDSKGNRKLELLEKGMKEILRRIYVDERII